MLPGIAEHALIGFTGLAPGLALPVDVGAQALHVVSCLVGEQFDGEPGAEHLTQRARFQQRAGAFQFGRQARQARFAEHRQRLHRLAVLEMHDREAGCHDGARHAFEPMLHLMLQDFRRLIHEVEVEQAIREATRDLVAAATGRNEGTELLIDGQRLHLGDLLLLGIQEQALEPAAHHLF